MTSDSPSDQPTPDTALAVSFLEKREPDGNHHLVAILPSGSVHAKSFKAGEENALRSWIDHWQGVANLYYQVNRLKTAVRDVKARKSDVAAGIYLHVDIDADDPRTLERITEFLPPPTVVVFSGGGYQLFWRLNKPCEELDSVERRNKALATALGGDNCHNIDRLMRLPGTINIPNAKKQARGRVNALSYIVKGLTNWSRAYSIDDFPEVADLATFSPLEVPDGDVQTITIDQLPAAVNAATRRLIRDGDDVEAPIGSSEARYHSRSELVYRVTCDLVRAGCEDVTIAGVLLNPELGVSASILEKPSAKRYAFRQIQSARESVNEDWPDLTKAGVPRASLRNTIRAYQRLGLHFEYDEFHRRKFIGGYVLQEYQGDISDDGCAILRHMVMEKFDFDPGKENSREAANILCLANTYHPVREYFSSVRWDGKPRLGSWLSTYLGSEATPLNSAVGKLVLIAAVRRIRKPGTKFDQIVVFEGLQGSGKSSALEILAGEDNFSDAEVLTLDPKSQMEALEGILIYEIGELEGISRADTARVKAFASRRVDRGRPAYGRFRENRPRQCVLIGTTNDDKYLRDQTGNRRFWPVETKQIDLEALRRDRDQLWAEAAKLEADGESLTLSQTLWDAARVEQEERLEDDPWMDALTSLKGNVEGGFERISTDRILTSILQIHRERQHQYQTKRLAFLMRKLGWAGPKRLRFRDGQVVRGYERPTTKRTGRSRPKF